jgi:hypothetical protein
MVLQAYSSPGSQEICEDDKMQQDRDFLHFIARRSLDRPNMASIGGIAPEDKAMTAKARRGNGNEWLFEVNVW